MPHSVINTSSYLEARRLRYFKEYEMVVGSRKNCIVCGKEIVTCVSPPYCLDCNPDLQRRLTEAKLEAAYQKREAWEEARRAEAPNPTQGITPDEYVKLAMRTECEELEPLARVCPLDGDPLLPIRMLHAVLGMTGEAGEVAETVKKWVYYGRPLDRQDVVEELGDLLWYVALACDALQVPLSEVMVANIRKLKSRFPEKFTPQRANDRDTTAERQAAGRTVPYPPGYDPEVCVTCRYGRTTLVEGSMCDGTSYRYHHTFVKASQLKRATKEREEAVAARDSIRENFEEETLGKVRDSFLAESTTKREPRDKRTRSQVLKERSSVAGCCDRHADNQACDCLERALPDGEEG